MEFGIRVLIIKGKHSGRMAHVVYEFYRHPDGFCQMEEGTCPDWYPVYLAVPIFDRCGEPRVVELKEDEFVEMK